MVIVLEVLDEERGIWLIVGFVFLERKGNLCFLFVFVVFSFSGFLLGGGIIDIVRCIVYILSYRDFSNVVFIRGWFSRGCSRFLVYSSGVFEVFGVIFWVEVLW